MNPLPKQWKATGLKLKSTKNILLAFLEMYEIEEGPPACKSAAIMSLWDHRGDVLPAIYSTYIHNLRFRLVCAYHAHYGVDSKTPTIHYDQLIGMMPMPMFIDLIKKAIKLPAEFCGDYYKK